MLSPKPSTRLPPRSSSAAPTSRKLPASCQTAEPKQTTSPLPSVSPTALEIKGSAKLGSGGHAKIVLGRYNGRRVAVKAMSRKDPQTRTELAVTTLLQAQPHPHVITTLPPVPSPDHKHIYLPMELADEDLLAHTDAVGGLEETDASLLFLQVIRGLRHLHGQGIYHLDVKPENVLMVGGVAKVSDFGTAHSCHELPSAELYCFGDSGSEPADVHPLVEGQLTNKSCGTSAYGCPEGLELMRARKDMKSNRVVDSPQGGLSHPPTTSKSSATTSPRQVTGVEINLDGLHDVGMMDGEKADVWSLGVTMFVTITGFFPWKSAAPDDMRYIWWVDACYTRRNTGGATPGFDVVFPRLTTQKGTVLSAVFKDLMHGMLHPDPFKRLTLSQVRGHPFFRR
jgi:serine/threonine protein kinase